MSTRLVRLPLADAEVLVVNVCNDCESVVLNELAHAKVCPGVSVDETVQAVADLRPFEVTVTDRWGGRYRFAHTSEVESELAEVDDISKAGMLVLLHAIVKALDKPKPRASGGRVPFPPGTLIGGTISHSPGSMTVSRPMGPTDA